MVAIGSQQSRRYAREGRRTASADIIVYGFLIFHCPGSRDRRRHQPIFVFGHVVTRVEPDDICVRIVQNGQGCETVLRTGCPVGMDYDGLRPGLTLVARYSGV